MSPTLRQLFAACFAATLCFACAPDRDKASETLVGQALDANARQQSAGAGEERGERTLTLETESGLYSAASGDNLRLPDNFPADIALPGDARIITATELGPTLSLGLHSPRSVAPVFADFRQAQRAAGWAETTVQDAARVRIAGFNKGGRRLEANFVDEPEGGTTLTISVGPAAH